MATTTERGIAVLETTDEVTHANINLISASTDAALAEQEPRQIYTVANVAERTALAGTFLPTSNKPLYVHRVNAGAGRQLERTLNGTTWETIPAESDTGWIDFTSFTSDFTPVEGTVNAYRIMNGTVTISVCVSGAFTSGTYHSVVAGIPNDIRPAASVRSGAMGSAMRGYCGLQVTAAGNIQLGWNNGGVSLVAPAWVGGTVTYPLFQ